MKHQKKTLGKIFAALPLVLGITTFLCIGMYVYGMNCKAYAYMGALFIGPIFAFVGILISLFTIKRRKVHRALWISGLTVCIIAFLLNAGGVGIFMCALGALTDLILPK